MKKPFLYLGVLVLILLIFSADAEAQCAMCKAVLESNMQSGEDAMGKGINGGIIYIMFVPYIIMAVAGYFTYKHIKKSNQAQA
tara:strand:- start:5336 stop:5584 length:249 start_codon:yes stop_codon:yes gene_type:complete